jgi:hypothetical protein
VWRFYAGAARPSSAGWWNFQLSCAPTRGQIVIPAPARKV